MEKKSLNEVNCPPHDWLKVLYWKHHRETILLPQCLIGTKTWEAVERHHLDRWQSDKLSAAMARQFFDGPEYIEGDLENGSVFFIPVYETSQCLNGILVWNHERRQRLDENIRSIFSDEYSYGGRDWEERANKTVNHLLTNFPADTWTPFVSLAAHHIVTWILHEQGEGAIKNALDYVKSELCILVFRVNEVQFYKLNELTSFYASREKTLEVVMGLLLNKMNNLYGVKIVSTRIGDELYTILVNRKIRGELLLDALLKVIGESGFQVIVELFTIPVINTESKMRGNRCWVINGKIIEKSYSYGFYLESSLSDNIDWGLIEQNQYIVWGSIEPKYNIEKSSQIFISEYCGEKMKNLPHAFEVTDKKYEVQASPDIMLSTMVGYQRFLDDCLNNLNNRGAVITRTFRKSLFVLGAKDYTEVFSEFFRLKTLSKRLHIPVNITMIITNSVVPFWKVMETFNLQPNKITIISKGGAILSLNERDVDLMNSVIPLVKGIKRTVWIHEIMPASARYFKLLEFELRSLVGGSKYKLTESQSKTLLDFALKLDQNHIDLDEEKRKRIRYDAFRRLSVFAGSNL